LQLERLSLIQKRNALTPTWTKEMNALVGNGGAASKASDEAQQFLLEANAAFNEARASAWRHGFIGEKQVGETPSASAGRSPNICARQRQRRTTARSLRPSIA
jgi:hypothetical protein